MTGHERRGWTLSPAAWSATEQLVWPLSQLWLTPLLLSRIGPEQFGYWVLALSLSIGAITLSLGRSAALVAEVSHLRANSQSALVAPLVVRVAGMVISAGALALSLWWIASLWFPAALTPAVSQPSAYVVAMAAMVVAGEIDASISGALKGLGRFRVSALSELAARGVQVVATTAFVAHGDDVLRVMVIAVFCSAGRTALKLIALRAALRTEAGARSAQPVCSPPHATLARTGFWLWLQALGGIAFYAFDRWFVGATLGPAALGAYAICNQLAQLPHSLAAAGAQPLIPWAAAQTSGPSRAVGRPLAAASVALGLLPALVALAAPAILAVWISPTFAADHATTAMGLCLVFALLAANVPSFNLLIGWGHARFAGILVVAAAAAFVVACLLHPPQNLIDMVWLKLAYPVVALPGIYYVVRLVRTRDHRPA
jgi:O-antigen/teichoic acid export membrane protein